MSGLERRDGRYVLTLPGGTVLPVFGTVLLLLGAWVLFNIPLVAVSSNTSVLQLSVMHQGLQFGIAAIGLNLLLRHTREVSFGHAAFFGVGAFTAGLLVAWHGIRSFLVLILAAVVVATLLAAVIGRLTLQHTGLYFALLTLAFGQLVFVLLRGEYVEGTDGFAVQTPSEEQALIFGQWAWPFETKAAAPDTIYFLGAEFAPAEYRSALLFWITAAVAIVGLLVMWRLVNSPFGKALDAIGQDTTRAQFIGIPTKRYLWIAFTISGIYGGFAGGMYAIVREAVRPETTLHAFVSGDILFMAVMGGYQTLIGPLVGGFVFEMTDFGARVVEVFGADGSVEVSGLVTGLVIVAIVFAFPEGIVGTASSWFDRLVGTVRANWRSPGAAVSRGASVPASLVRRVLTVRYAIGVAAGLAALIVSYAAAYVQKSSQASAYAGTIGDLAGTAPSDLTVVSWTLTRLHNVNVGAVVDLSGEPAYTKHLSDLAPFEVAQAAGNQAPAGATLAPPQLDALLLYLPPFVLVAAGYVTVRSADLTSPTDGFKQCIPVLTGYFAGTLALLVSLQWTAGSGDATISIDVMPDLLSGLLTMGLVYPVLFAGLGCAIAGSHLPTVLRSEAGNVRDQIGGWARTYPLGRGAVTGLLAFAGTFGATYVLRSDVVTEYADALGAIAPSSPATWKVTAWLFDGAHNALVVSKITSAPTGGGDPETVVTPLNGTTAADVAGATNTSVGNATLPPAGPDSTLLYIPVVVLLVAGFVVAQSSRTSGWYDGVKASLTVGVGYAIPAIGLALVSGWTVAGDGAASVTIAPRLVSIVVVVGVLYPLMFVSLGGAIGGATVAGVRSVLDRAAGLPGEVVR